MRLSLSVRIAEAPGTKDRALIGMDDLARLAVENGYRAVCMRASQAGVDTPRERVAAIRQRLDAQGLAVSMVTGDIPIPAWARGPVRYDPIPLHDPRGIDFPAVFAGLARIGYEGCVTVHQALAEIMDPPEAARVSAEYLRTLARFD